MNAIEHINICDKSNMEKNQGTIAKEKQCCHTQNPSSPCTHYKSLDSYIFLKVLIENGDPLLKDKNVLY